MLLPHTRSNPKKGARRSKKGMKKMEHRVGKHSSIESVEPIVNKTSGEKENENKSETFPASNCFCSLHFNFLTWALCKKS